MNITVYTAKVFAHKNIYGAKKMSTKQRLKKRKIKIRRF